MGWTHSCRRLKDTLFRIQEGSTCEVLNNLVFVMVDQSVLSAFDWFFGKPTTFFMVVKVDRIELRLSGQMNLVDDIMKVKGKDTMSHDVCTNW